MIQHMLLAVERTLKQRFHLSDKDINGLNIAQGVSLVTAVIIFGFFGNFRAKKIHCIASGLAVTGKLNILRSIGDDWKLYHLHQRFNVSPYCYEIFSHWTARVLEFELSHISRK